MPGRRSAHKGTVASLDVVCCLSAHLSSVASPTFSRTTSGRASRVNSDIAALTGSARAARQSIAQSTTNASGSPSSPQTRILKRSRWSIWGFELRTVGIRGRNDEETRHRMLAPAEPQGSTRRRTQFSGCTAAPPPRAQLGHMSAPTALGGSGSALRTCFRQSSESNS